MRIAYCIKCGNKFPEEAVFCPYCGTKVYRPEDDAPAPEIVKEEPAPIVEPVTPEPEPVIEAPVVPEVSEPEQILEPIEQETSEQEVQPDVEAIPVEEPVQETKEEEPTIVAPAEEVPVDEDELEDPKIGVCILAFFFPIVGFIAAASNRGTNKKKSKTYAMWAWIGFGRGFISQFIQAAI